jgi:hypothetical protein
MRIPVPTLALLAIFLYRAPSRLASGVIDPDYWWHIGYGEWILAHGRLPTVDFWSWTFDGHAYRLTQWLGEVAMAVANGLAGEPGTQALSALLATLAIAFSYLAARVSLDNRLAALTIAVGCNALLLSLPCRPHQFTHLALAVLSYLIALYQATGDRRLLILTVPLFISWVNLHGGYALGLACLWMVAGLVATEAYVRHDRALLARFALPLGLAALASTLATLANPYGAGAWLYAVEIASMKASATGAVDEWAPTSIKLDTGLHYFAVTAAVFATLAASRERPRLSVLLGALLLAGLGWTSARLSLMVSILAVPLIAQHLRHTPLYDLAFAGAAARYDRTLSPFTATALALGIGASSYAIAGIDETAARVLEQTLPAQEVRFMRANRLGGRILNSPDIGGYLIRNLGARVALDTRYDLYGDRAFFEFLFARRGAPGWDRYVARLAPDVVVIESDSALRELLRVGPDYRLVFEGPRHSILIPAAARPDLPTRAPGKPRGAILLESLQS